LILKTIPEQAVILCGGIGSRLRPYTNENPKPMIACNGKPFLWFILQQLSDQGISKFVLLTGYLGHKIKDYFGDGRRFGWQIQYSMGPVNWDTGKRLWEAQEVIEDQFLILYSDNFVPFSLDKLNYTHLKNNLPLTLMVSQKCPGNIKLDNTGLVLKYDNSRSSSFLDYVEIGYMLVQKNKTLSFYESPDCSFFSILERMSKDKQISSFIQHNSYYSVSDPERWKIAEKYLKPKKIILIDRDGVINHKAPKGEYISKWEDFIFIRETYEAMKYLSKGNFKFIVITNQAGVARGKIKLSELDRIHQNMVNEFKKEGIEILDIYVCKHHWDKGCFCRKPNPGMLFQASKMHSFRLDQALFIGDDLRDCQTAENAGCNSVFVGQSDELKKLSKKEQPINSSTSLLGSIDEIVEFYESISDLEIL
jgi:histidinol-phosphate phosphatase family protein